MSAALLLTLAVPAAVAAQEEPAGLLAAEAEAHAAAQREVCRDETTEIRRALIARRRARDEVVQRALAVYVEHLRLELAACIERLPPDSGRSMGIPTALWRPPAREPRPGSPREGRFDGGALEARVRAYGALLHGCYERDLVLNPLLRGRLELHLTIEPDGRVTNLYVTSDTVGASVGACLARIVGDFRFDPPPVGGPVTYVLPFVFEPPAALAPPPAR